MTVLTHYATRVTDGISDWQIVIANMQNVWRYKSNAYSKFIEFINE